MLTYYLIYTVSSVENKFRQSESSEVWSIKNKITLEVSEYSRKQFSPQTQGLMYLYQYNSSALSQQFPFSEEQKILVAAAHFTIFLGLVICFWHSQLCAYEANAEQLFFPRRIKSEISPTPPTYAYMQIYCIYTVSLRISRRMELSSPAQYLTVKAYTTATIQTWSSRLITRVQNC